VRQCKKVRGGGVGAQVVQCAIPTEYDASAGGAGAGADCLGAGGCWLAAKCGLALPTLTLPFSKECRALPQDSKAEAGQAHTNHKGRVGGKDPPPPAATTSRQQVEVMVKKIEEDAGEAKEKEVGSRCHGHGQRVEDGNQEKEGVLVQQK
jgi:hypothetical protein